MTFRLSYTIHPLASGVELLRSAQLRQQPPNVSRGPQSAKARTVAVGNYIWSGASLHTRRPAEVDRINILRFILASPLQFQSVPERSRVGRGEGNAFSAGSR